MKDLLEFSDEQLFHVDRYLFLLKQTDRFEYYTDDNLRQRNIEPNILLHTETRLINSNIIDTIFSAGHHTFNITAKGKKILELYGSLSLYIDSEKQKNFNINLAKKAFKQNTVALTVTIIALITSIIFNMINLYNR